MINEIGRYLQVPEAYLSSRWQNFQENPIDSKVCQVAKVIFSALYYTLFPFTWGLSKLGKFIASKEIEASLVRNNFIEENPVSKWKVNFNFDPEFMRLAPKPITIPNNLESDLSYLEGECLRRAKSDKERDRIRHAFRFTRLNDSIPRQNAYVYFKAMEQKIREKDENLSEGDIETFFVELMAGFDKCEPTWYIAAEEAFERAANGSCDQNILRLVQKYKEELFMDPSILPEGLKDADWNIVNAARIYFGDTYGLQSAERAQMDVHYLIQDRNGTTPVEIFLSASEDIHKKIGEKLQDTHVLIEWIRTKINIDRPHSYYDFIKDIVQKRNLAIGPEKFFDEEDNYFLTREGAILMLVDVGVLIKTN